MDIDAMSQIALRHVSWHVGKVPQIQSTNTKNIYRTFLRDLTFLNIKPLESNH